MLHPCDRGREDYARAEVVKLESPAVCHALRVDDVFVAAEIFDA